MVVSKAQKQTVVRSDFTALLADVQQRIQTAQTRAVLAINSELVRLYWDIGRIIDQRQKTEGWGAAVIPRLAFELKNEMPELKGFSERNIKRMLSFYREYPETDIILPQVAAKAPQAAAKLESAPKVPQLAAQMPDSLLWSFPWAHHVILMDKVPDISIRRWYMEQTLANGWSRNILAMQIEAQAHARHGKARSNFALTLPKNLKSALPTVEEIKAELGDLTRNKKPSQPRGKRGGLECREDSARYGTGNIAIMPAPFDASDGADTPFGCRWGGESVNLTPAHLTALKAGKTLTIDVRDEYVMFLNAGSAQGKRPGIPEGGRHGS